MDSEAAVEEEAAEATLRLWDTSRVEEVEVLAALVGRTEELWDDNSRAQAQMAFQAIYLHPNSVVFEIGHRAGLLVVYDTIPGFRAKVMVAGWKKEGLRVPTLWRRAIQAAMIRHDLLLVEGLIREDNTLSLEAAASTGFEKRGLLARPTYYNGEPKRLVWLTLTREQAGVED